MNRWCLVLGALGVGSGLIPREDSTEWTIVVGGDTAGYLAPCGCAKPMVGGVQRRAALVRNWTASGSSLVLELGPLSSGLGRQSELKAETMAEIVAGLQADAVGLASEDASLGSGVVGAMARLSGDRLVSLALRPSETFQLPAMKVKGPFAVTSASVAGASVARALREAENPMAAALATFVSQSKDAEKVAVLLLDGREADARRVAEDHPGLSLVVYRSQGDPPDKPIRVGKCWLITPGEKGKHLVRFAWSEGQLRGYQVAKLGADLADDEQASELYREYLGRVRAEGLLAKRARRPGDPFAGSEACGACHSAAYDVWKGSAHGRALASLEATGHDADPDCVGCHVVGLDLSSGFQSRKLTPQLADVGCETCHGPGAAHVSDPGAARMGKAGQTSCGACHVPDHSPGFDYAAYWDRIKH